MRASERGKVPRPQAAAAAHSGRGGLQGVPGRAAGSRGCPAGVAEWWSRERRVFNRIWNWRRIELGARLRLR